MSSVAKKLTEIMAEVKAVGKDSKNQKQGFSFRGIDAVMNHLHPIFAKHGVVVLPSVLEEKTEDRQTKSGGNLIYRVLKVRFDFVDDEGSVLSAIGLGEGMDSGDKAATKAMSAALKYVLTQTFLLPYDEVDADNTTPEPSTPKAKKVAKSSPPVVKKAKAAPAPEKAVKQVADDGECIEIDELPNPVLKEGESAKGPWIKYAFTIDGTWYSTFDDGIHAAIDANVGEQVTIAYTEDKYGRKITSIEPGYTGVTTDEDNLDMGDVPPDEDSESLPF